MLFWLVFNCWASYPVARFTPWIGSALLLFILLLLLGWKVFGKPLEPDK
jgi:hypothetical protein